MHSKVKYYPTTIEAIHLLVLYVFLQSLVDFPLALYDYHHDTDWLSNGWIGFGSTVLITAFIFFFGFKKTGNTFKKVFALKLFNPWLILPVLIILPGMQYLVGLLNHEVDKILPAPPWFWELFERIFDNRFGFWGAVAKVVIIAPVIEETLFRGIIMHGLMRNYKPWYAVLLSGILFSVFHLNPWQMTYTFFLGLLLGWVMIKTRSLPFAILVHALNNLIVMLSITFGPQYASHPILNLPKQNNIWISSTAVFTGVVIILIITYKKRRKSKPKIVQAQ